MNTNPSLPTFSSGGNVFKKGGHRRLSDEHTFLTMQRTMHVHRSTLRVFTRRARIYNLKQTLKASLNFQKQCGRSGCSIFFSSDLKLPIVCSILGEVRVKGTEVVSRLYSLVLPGGGVSCQRGREESVIKVNLAYLKPLSNSNQNIWLSKLFPLTGSLCGY